MHIKRFMEDVVSAYGSFWPAVLVTGPRHAGKTTVLRRLARSEGRRRAYVTFEDLELREQAKADPKVFLRKNPPPVIFDEIQHVPELLPYIKMHVDDAHAAGDFWLAGSRMLPLMEGMQELAGRVGIFHLSPLSQREIAGLAPRPFSPGEALLRGDAGQSLSPADVYARLWRGGMPGFVGGLHRQEESIPEQAGGAPGIPDAASFRGFYGSYEADILARDVADLLGRVDAARFHRFFRAAASRTSRLLNCRAIAGEARVAEAEARSWVRVLENLGIVFLLHPHAGNALKRAVRTPKLYFYDTGLVCLLSGMADADLAQSHAMSGALLENFAISEIVKGWQNAGVNPFNHFMFYRDRDGSEIDLLIQINGKIVPVEIEKSASPDSGRIERRFGILSRTSSTVAPGAVLCLADRAHMTDGGTCVAPIWAI